MTSTAAERVRNSRWVNKLEDLADQMLAHLALAPDPLPRSPVIDPGLLDQLSQFTLEQDDVAIEEIPSVRFLELGNGHQTSNRRKALKAAAKLVPWIRVIDDNTVETEPYGVSHFAAFTHLVGAMISSTRQEDLGFGGAPWHSKQRIVLFRDAGDGRCIVYLCPIERLLELRSIGHHGVRWDDVAASALKTEVIRSVDAIKALE